MHFNFKLIFSSIVYIISIRKIKWTIKRLDLQQVIKYWIRENDPTTLYIIKSEGENEFDPHIENNILKASVMACLNEKKNLSISGLSKLKKQEI